MTKKRYCYRVKMDNEDPLLSRPYFWYVIAETMEHACEYIRKHPDKNVFHEIKTCELLGDAP
jgi:hypothetical protein